MNNGSDATPHPLGQWTTGLCGCCEDPSNCWLTLFCPIFTFARNAEVIDKGITKCGSAAKISFWVASLGVAFLYTCGYRRKLRNHFNLPAEPCNDCCVHYWCAYCALCQEHRELKNRGLNPALGWVGNQEQMKIATQVPPNVAPGMTR